MQEIKGTITIKYEGRRDLQRELHVESVLNGLITNMLYRNYQVAIRVHLDCS